MTELHPGRTRRLATAARHAFLHRGAEGVVDGCVARLDGPHRGDAASRRGDLAARDPVGRTMWKAQTARHTCVQGVGVESQRPGHDVNRFSGAYGEGSASTPD